MKITSLHSYPFITWRIDNAVTSERSVTLLNPLNLFHRLEVSGLGESYIGLNNF